MFKDGSKVRVKEVKVGTMVKGVSFVEGMLEMIGREYVIENEAYDARDNSYKINKYWFAEEWLELVEEEKDKIIFAKVREDAIIPSKREADGCYDVYSSFDEEMFVIQPHQVRLIPTGIASAFDKKYRIGIRERGSNTKGTLIVMAGQIDSNFRGEWFVALYNGNDIPVAISKEVTDVVKTEDYIQVPYTKAIAQFAVEIVPEVEVKEVTFDDIKAIKSERGNGMLGSSGK